jgi:hypothetical protein
MAKMLTTSSTKYHAIIFGFIFIYCPKKFDYPAHTRLGRNYRSLDALE